MELKALFVNGNEIYKFKAKDSEIEASLCRKYFKRLGNIEYEKNRI